MENCYMYNLLEYRANRIGFLEIPILFMHKLFESFQQKIKGSSKFELFYICETSIPLWKNIHVFNLCYDPFTNYLKFLNVKNVNIYFTK